MPSFADYQGRRASKFHSVRPIFLSVENEDMCIVSSKLKIEVNVISFLLLFVRTWFIFQNFNGEVEKYQGQKGL